MIFQRCKLCGTRSDSFGCYERCSAEGPWHEWGDFEVIPEIHSEQIEITEPEFLGEFPLRQDIEIIPASAPNDIKIGWQVQTYVGCEVFGDAARTVRLTKYTDIYPGREVYLTWNENSPPLIVNANGDVETENHLFPLAFDKDSRHCWTNTGIINKKVFSFNIELK